MQSLNEPLSQVSAVNGVPNSGLMHLSQLRGMCKTQKTGFELGRKAVRWSILGPSCVVLVRGLKAIIIAEECKRCVTCC